MAYLGIFWFDVKNESLEGVFKDFENNVAENYNGSRFYPTLHQDVWQDLYNECHDRFGEILKGYEDSIYVEQDYTLVPRRRVSSTSDEYQVFVGDWFDEVDQDFVKQLVLDEFCLLEDETIFVHDYHWDIGQGWGE